MLTIPINENQRGFTLIELMIVIGIIGILAAIAIPQFSAYRTRSYNSLAKSDLRNAATAQEAYYADNREYTNDPNTLIGAGAYPSAGVTLLINSASNTNYDMEASHTSGDKIYSLTGPGGSITSN